MIEKEGMKWATPMEREWYCLYCASLELGYKPILNLYTYLSMYSFNMQELLGGEWRTYEAVTNTSNASTYVSPITLKEYYKTHRDRYLTLIMKDYMGVDEE